MKTCRKISLVTKLFVFYHWKIVEKRNSTFPKQLYMKQQLNNKEEQIEISFFGLKFKCSNPTSKAILILIILLIFFLVLVVLVPHL